MKDAMYICLLIAYSVVFFISGMWYQADKDVQATSDAFRQGYELGKSSQGDDCEIMKQYSYVMWEYYCDK